MNSTSVVAMTAAAIGLCAAAMPKTSGPSPQSASVNLEMCVAQIDGWDHPESVPASLAWESFFESVQTPGSPTVRALGVDGNAQAITTTFAQQALSRKRASQQSSVVVGQSNPMFGPDRIEADAIAAARDDLARSLPETSFARLKEAADANTRSRSFTLPVRGQVIAQNGTNTCRVTVVGKLHPHLIPEAESWEFYFTSLAMAASPARVGHDNYTADFLLGIQKYALQMDLAQIRRVLAAATDTADLLSEMKRRGADSQSIASVVLKAREELLRALPGSAWLTVNKEVNRTRTGMTFVFYGQPQVP